MVFAPVRERKPRSTNILPKFLPNLFTDDRPMRGDKTSLLINGRSLHTAMKKDAGFDLWFERELICPRDQSELRYDGEQLVCPLRHRIPDRRWHPDHADRRRAADASGSDGTVVCGRGRKCSDPCTPKTTVPSIRSCRRPSWAPTATCTDESRESFLVIRYRKSDCRRRPTARKSFSISGCNWGRWSIAAARRGYRPVGMDPGLESILPARRIARQLRVEARFLVGDARYIPFRDGRFDVVYSYGVLQHFSPADARLAIAEASRVLAPSGTVLIQMAARYGLLSILQQARRGFRDARGFEVRYWKPSAIEGAFRSLIGPTRLSVDGYFTLNPQPGDMDLMPPHYRQIVRLSEALRSLTHRIPALLRIADSIFATAVKPAVASIDAQSRFSTGGRVDTIRSDEGRSGTLRRDY